MKVAEVLRRHPESGEVEVIGRVVAGDTGRPAVIEAGDPAFREMIELLLEAGISGPDGRTLRLDDGEAFVAALPEELRGSRLWAELVRPFD
jgi:hypothetical protein